MKKELTDKEIRKALKDRGADRVRHNADGSWDALWYDHDNAASCGKWLHQGNDNDDVARALHI